MRPLRLSPFPMAMKNDQFWINENKRVFSFGKTNFDQEKTQAYSVGNVLFCIYVVECLSVMRREFRLKLDFGAIDTIS